MERYILAVARLLRKAGVKVSSREVLDCVTGLQVTGCSPGAIRDVMLATLVKSPREQIILLSLLKHLWPSEDAQRNGNGILPVAQTRDGSGRAQSSGEVGVDFLAALLTPAYFEPEIWASLAVESLTAEQLSGSEDLEALARQAQINLDWFMVKHGLEKSYANNTRLQMMAKQRLARVQTLIRHNIESRIIRMMGEPGLLKVMCNADFFLRGHSFLPDQQAEIRHQLAILAKKLSMRTSSRYRRSTGVRGTIDLRRTCNRSMRSAGIPIKLERRRKTLQLSELVVLCDISQSVAPYSYFMLSLVYTAQNLNRKKVRSFVFVDDIEEVTALLRDLPFNQAIGRINKESRTTVSTLSNFGRVFGKFREKYLSSINRKACMVILGDGKNHWRPPRTEDLAIIAKHVERIYWLNPLPAEQWNTGDSAMGHYAPFCHRVLECRNLSQLAEFVHAIAKGG